MKWLVVAVLLLVQQQQPMRVAWGSIGTIDPALAFSPQDRRVVEALFSGLIDAKVADRTITFKVPDAKWSDGKPVTAQDYRFAWLRCITPSTGSPWSFLFFDIKHAESYYESERLADVLLEYETRSAADRKDLSALAVKSASKRHVNLLKEAIAIEKEDSLKKALTGALAEAESNPAVEETWIGIEAVDDRTLRVTFGERGTPANFPAVAAMTPFLPVPKHVVTVRHGEWTHPQNFVSCGAFGLLKWVNQEMVIARAKGGEVAIKMLDRAAEAWPLYEKGELDWIDGGLVPPEKIEELKKSGELRARPTDTILQIRHGSNVGKTLRLAIAQGIDRKKLVEAAGPGAAEERGNAPAKDTAAALTSLITEVGDLSKLPRLNFLYWKDPSIEGIAKVLRDQLQTDLSLQVRIDCREWPAYQKAREAGEYDVLLETWTPAPGTAAKPAEDAVPLLREGTYLAAKPYVEVTPGMKLQDVRLKR